MFTDDYTAPEAGWYAAMHDVMGARLSPLHCDGKDWFRPQWIPKLLPIAEFTLHRNGTVYEGVWEAPDVELDHRGFEIVNPYGVRYGYRTMPGMNSRQHYLTWEPLVYAGDTDAEARLQDILLTVLGDSVIGRIMGGTVEHPVLSSMTMVPTDRPTQRLPQRFESHDDAVSAIEQYEEEEFENS